MKLFILMTLALIPLTGCLKTAEQIRREQRVESLSQELADSQNIVADLTVMLKNLQSQIDTLNGRVEELQQGQKVVQSVDLKGMSENVTVLKQQLEALTITQTAQSEEIKQQRVFIEKVTNKLGKISTPSENAQKNPKEEIQAALKLVGRKKWKEARQSLETLVDSPNLTAADVNKVYHGLGLVEFGQKNWEKSLVFFSKIYTKYPKSSLAPSSLLYIGKALDQLGKKEESNQAFKELKSQYPQSAAAKEVR
jgi:TolA-binding protein